MNEQKMDGSSSNVEFFAIPKAPSEQSEMRRDQPSVQHFYTPPEWSSRPPSDTYALEVIKEGKVIEQVPLESDHVLFGRQRDLVHIGMDHQSISRVHAVINFHRDGSVMIMDMSSAHGTFVNKNRLPSAKYTKLQVNDVIKFGASTRMYILQGSSSDDNGVVEEEESDSLRLLRLRAEEKNKQRLLAKEREAANSGISWGMDDSDDLNDIRTPTADEIAIKGGKVSLTQAQTENNDDERFTSLSRQHSLPEYLRKDENYDRKYGEQYVAAISDEEAVSERDKSTVEKIRKKEKKIQHMQEENRRIYLKEHNQDDGLTEGQLSAVQRNDSSITILKTEIDQLIHTIRAKHAPPTSSSSSSSVTRKRTIDEVEDSSSSAGGGGMVDESEVYDISDATADPNTNWRLRKKLSQQQHRHTSNSSSSHPCSSSSSSSSSSMNGAAAMSYEEIQSQLSLAQAEQVKLSSTITSLQASLSRDESLLQYGNEDEVGLLLISDRSKENRQRLQKMINSEQADNERRVAQLKKMLIVATPALKSLVVKSSTAAAAAATTATGHHPALHQPPSTVSSDSSRNISNTSTNVSSNSSSSHRLLSIDDPEAEQRASRDKAFEDFKRFIEDEQEQQGQSSSSKMAVDDDDDDDDKFDIANSTPAYTNNKPNNNRNNRSHANANKKAAAAAGIVKGPSSFTQAASHDDMNNSRLETLAAVQRGQISERQVSQGGELIWVPPSSKQKGDATGSSEPTAGRPCPTDSKSATSRLIQQWQ